MLSMWNAHKDFALAYSMVSVQKGCQGVQVDILLLFNIIIYVLIV